MGELGFRVQEFYVFLQLPPFTSCFLALQSTKGRINEPKKSFFLGLKLLRHGLGAIMSLLSCLRVFLAETAAPGEGKCQEDDSRSNFVDHGIRNGSGLRLCRAGTVADASSKYLSSRLDT